MNFHTCFDSCQAELQNKKFNNSIEYIFIIIPYMWLVTPFGLCVDNQVDLIILGIWRLVL